MLANFDTTAVRFSQNRRQVLYYEMIAEVAVAVSESRGRERGWIRLDAQEYFTKVNCNLSDDKCI